MVLSFSLPSTIYKGDEAPFFSLMPSFEIEKPDSLVVPDCAMPGRMVRPEIFPFRFESRLSFEIIVLLPSVELFVLISITPAIPSAPYTETALLSLRMLIDSILSGSSPIWLISLLYCLLPSITINGFTVPYDELPRNLMVVVLEPSVWAKLARANPIAKVKTIIFFIMVMF
ncbi:hypothetical protein D3C73_950220 [compost metagenome]